MGYLTGVTMLWAFSYSLIGVYLSGQVDGYFAVMTRIVLASLVFLPLLRPRAIAWRARAGLMGIGAIQLGIMYLFFYQSFLLLTVPEVLLFTIFTPIYITLIDDALAGRFSPRVLGVAALAVAGAAVIRYDGVTQDFWLGFLVVQGANMAFAFGQVGYRHLLAGLPEGIPHRQLFGWFHLGALMIAVPAFLVLGNATQMPTQWGQWAVLGWLGVVASGLGYFLWNTGACRVDAGKLAIMNNALIPAGLLVNLLIWNREADLPRLALGAVVLVASLWLNEHWARGAKAPEAPSLATRR